MFESHTDNLRLMYSPGAAETIVIAFAHLDYPADREHFWGQDAFAKNGLAAIGLICKSGCWFPTADVRQLAPVINEITAGYKNIVLYGFSMGGYAAVKFSRLLNCTCAIALSPQFSIDPADVYPMDGRLVQLFDSKLNESMKIVPSDMAGRVFLFCDPYFSMDWWHCAQIIAQADEKTTVHLINVPRIGHETITVFASTEALAELIRLCLCDDISELRRVTSGLRRRHHQRIFYALANLRKSRPERAEAWFNKEAPRLGAFWRQQWTSLPPP